MGAELESVVLHMSIVVLLFYLVVLVAAAYSDKINTKTSLAWPKTNIAITGHVLAVCQCVYVCVVKGGGDQASRAIFLGSVLGAVGGEAAIPDEFKK
mgnify:CR=1 FL=1